MIYQSNILLEHFWVELMGEVHGEHESVGFEKRSTHIFIHQVHEDLLQTDDTRLRSGFATRGLKRNRGTKSLIRKTKIALPKDETSKN